MREQKAWERKKTREKRRRENVSFSRWPASSAPPPSTPPSPLGSQVAGLGTDGPPSRLHAGPAGPSKHKTAVVGGHQPDEVQKAEWTSSVWRTGTQSPSTQRTRRAEPGELEEQLFSRKWHTSLQPCRLFQDRGTWMYLTMQYWQLHVCYQIKHKPNSRGREVASVANCSDSSKCFTLSKTFAHHH